MYSDNPFSFIKQSRSCNLHQIKPKTVSRLWIGPLCRRAADLLLRKVNKLQICGRQNLLSQVISRDKRRMPKQHMFFMHEFNFENIIKWALEFAFTSHFFRFSLNGNIKPIPPPLISVDTSHSISSSSECGIPAVYGLPVHSRPSSRYSNRSTHKRGHQHSAASSSGSTAHYSKYSNGHQIYHHKQQFVK